MTTILKVLVGSRAHGLNDDDSDYDYRGVYIISTREILKLGYKYKGTHWIEGEEKDNTSYEIGHFLFLATKCNPSILEVFKAPVIGLSKEGEQLRKLFKYVWTPKRAFDAFTGYSKNQRKKFLKDKDNRRDKYAIAYLRTLSNLIDLLLTGDFSLEVKPKFKNDLLKIRSGNYRTGWVMDKAEALEKIAESALPKCKQKQDINKVNEFLLKIRKSNWSLKPARKQK